MGNNIVDSPSAEPDNVRRDRLDRLVRKIFIVIDTYYVEWQAEEIKKLIQVFIEESK